MKNSIKAIASIGLITGLLSGNSYAQQADINAPARPSYANNSTAVSSTNSDPAAVNPGVTAKFSTLFPTATDSKWTSSNNNFWVSFLNNGRKANASFTPKGKMNYVITDCTIEQLPGSFRKTINKEYSSYKLYNAIEIKAYNAVAYQAILENESAYITLKFTSEGVEEIQHCSKALL